MLEKTIFLDLPFNASQCVDILLEASTAMLRWQIVSIDRVQNSLLWKVSGYDFTGHKYDWAKVRASCLQQNSGGCAIELKVTSGGLLDIRDELGKLLRPFATSIENVAKVKQEAREAEEKELKKGIVCPTCKAEIESGMRFCPQDGTPIGNICIHCNTWNAPEANFCSGCGSRILQPNRLTAQEIQQEAEMVKWEYMRVLAEYDKRKKGWSVEGIDMMAYLNQLGQQGWEIIGYQDNTTFNQFGNITEEWKSFLMKRPMVQRTQGFIYQSWTGFWVVFLFICNRAHFSDYKCRR